MLLIVTSGNNFRLFSALHGRAKTPFEWHYAILALASKTEIDVGIRLFTQVDTCNDSRATYSSAIESLYNGDTVGSGQLHMTDRHSIDSCKADLQIRKYIS